MNRRQLGWTLAGAVALTGSGIAFDRAKASEPPAVVAPTSDNARQAEKFAREAATAREEAARHRAMGESYRRAGGPLVAKWHLDEHCRKLVERYEGAAKELDAMADAHRKLEVGK